jgi:4-amino-4-deoxy-L-arabinose transferase-like glycosyltransferase
MVIVSLGTFLRLYRLSSNSLWFDEAMSVWFSNHSLADTLLMQTAADVHPPFYYLLLNLWMRVFGSGEYGVRFLSVVFGVLSIPLLYLIVKDLFGEPLALMSAFIISLSPFHIYYSQEARMYSLLTFLALLSIFFMDKMLYIDGDKKEKWIHSVGYVVSTIIALYSHNIALFLPIAQNLFFISFWNRHKASLKVWIPSGVMILLLWVPWAFTFLKQGLSVQKSFYAPPLTSESVVNVFSIFNNAPTFWLFNWMDLGLNLIRGKLVLLTIIFYGGLFLIGVVSMRHNPRSLTFLLLIFSVPLGAELFMSFKHSILAPQTLIWASVPYFVLIAKGISGLRNKWTVALALGLLIVFSSCALYEYYTEFEKERWDLAAKYVAEKADERDLILFSSGFAQIPFDYYFSKYNKPLEKRGLPQDFSEKRMTLEKLSVLENLIQDRKRVWLIYGHEWFTDPERLSQATLRKNYRLLEERDFKSGQSNITCYLFELKLH